MGSPISPIIADLVLQDMEKRALKTVGFSLPFYVCYVDDVATAVLSYVTNEILDIFNSFFFIQGFNLLLRLEAIN